MISVTEYLGGRRRPARGHPGWADIPYWSGRDLGQWTFRHVHRLATAHDVAVDPVPVQGRQYGPGKLTLVGAAGPGVIGRGELRDLTLLGIMRRLVRLQMGAEAPGPGATLRKREIVWLAEVLGCSATVSGRDVGIARPCGGVQVNLSPGGGGFREQNVLLAVNCAMVDPWHVPCCCGGRHRSLDDC